MDRLIEFFIDEPEREFHVRELAKKLNKSPTTVSKYLKDYEIKKILISQKRLNHLLFRANTESNEFKQLKLNHNLKKISTSGLIEYLIDFFNHPEAIVLFGSFAKAENSSESDLDLLIISSKRQEPNLDKFRKKLGYEIQTFVHSSKELVQMQKTNKELLNNFLNGIVLYGFLEVFK